MKTHSHRDICENLGRKMNSEKALRAFASGRYPTLLLPVGKRTDSVLVMSHCWGKSVPCHEPCWLYWVGVGRNRQKQFVVCILFNASNCLLNQLLKRIFLGSMDVMLVGPLLWSRLKYHNSGMMDCHEISYVQYIRGSQRMYPNDLGDPLTFLCHHDGDVCGFECKTHLVCLSTMSFLWFNWNKSTTLSVWCERFHHYVFPLPQ